MDRKRMISDAAKELGVESHVLRYWEEELNLPIPRNEMGHRYYGDHEIKLLKEVKEQKKQGAQLKEIKQMLPSLLVPQPVQQEKTKVIPFPNEQNERMEQFQDIMVKIVGQALKKHEADLSRQMGQRVADQVVKEMDFHFREQEAAEEERYQKFDEMVRGYQRARSEVAAAEEKRRGFFRRRRKEKN